MTIQDWGSIGELIGAIAVIVTLVYLSIQIRQNSKVVRTSNATTVHINTQVIAQAPMMDRELGEIILRAVSDEEELRPAEQLAAWAWFYQMIKTGELAHRSFVLGELEQEYWEASMKVFRSFYGTPGFMRYWEERREAFTPSYREIVEKWMNEASTPLKRADVLFSRTTE